MTGNFNPNSLQTGQQKPPIRTYNPTTKINESEFTKFKAHQNDEPNPINTK
jgi:hypothetical protein